MISLSGHKHFEDKTQRLIGDPSAWLVHNSSKKK